MADASAPLVEAKPKRKLRKYVKRSIVFMIVGLIIWGIVYLAGQMLVGQSEGVIVNAIPDNPAPAAPAVELEQFEGVDFTFAYPNSYIVQPANKNNPNSLETHTFVASGMMSKVLTVVVTKLPSGRLEDDTSYYMRTQHPEVYKLSTRTVAGEKVVMALDAKNSQQAAFWVHKSAAGSKLLSFTITSVSINSDATTQEYQKMLESIKWR